MNKKEALRSMTIQTKGISFLFLVSIISLFI